MDKVYFNSMLELEEEMLTAKKERNAKYIVSGIRDRSGYIYDYSYTFGLNLFTKGGKVVPDFYMGLYPYDASKLIIEKIVDKCISGKIPFENCIVNVNGQKIAMIESDEIENLIYSPMKTVNDLYREKYGKTGLRRAFQMVVAKNGIFPWEKPLSLGVKEDLYFKVSSIDFDSLKTYNLD